MTVLHPTKRTGAVVKAAPGVYAEPDQTVTEPMLAEQLVVDGLDTGFLADLLSAYLTHERCGRHLYRSVAGRTTDPVLREHYEVFGVETERHVEILEGLVVASGGNPSYVSPLARTVEASDSKALESTFLAVGAVDPLTAEMAMLDAVFVAEALDRANWQTLARLGPLLPPELSEACGTAVAEVLSQEDEHYGWAADMRATMSGLRLSPLTGLPAATTAVPPPVPDEVDEVDGVESGTVDASDAAGAANDPSAEETPSKRELYEEARAADVPGRSHMTKDELADALREQQGKA